MMSRELGGLATELRRIGVDKWVCGLQLISVERAKWNRIIPLAYCVCSVNCHTATVVMGFKFAC